MQGDVSEITMQVKLAFVVTESDERYSFPYKCFFSCRKKQFCISHYLCRAVDYEDEMRIHSLTPATPHSPLNT